MSFLDVLGRLLGLATKASDDDEAQRRKIAAAKLSGKTAGELAQEAEAEAARLRRTVNRESE